MNKPGGGSFFSAKLFPPGGTGRKMLTVSSGAAGGYIVALLLTPALTRIYTPADFGTLAVYMSVVGIIGQFATLSLGQAVPVVATEREARSILATSIGFISLTTITAFICFLLLRNVSTPFSTIERLRPYYWIIPIGIFGTGCNVLTSWGTRQREYKIIARAKFTQTSGQVVFQILFGILQHIPGAILLGDALGRLLGNFTFLRLGQLWKDLWVKPQQWHQHVRISWENKNFWIYGLGYNMLSVIGQQISTLGLSTYFNAWDIGVFAIASRLTSVPVTFIGNAASQVFLGETSHAMRNRSESFHNYFIVALKKLHIVGLILAGGILLLSPLLIGRILGEQWKLAGWIMALRAPVVWLQVLVIPASDGFLLLQRQGLRAVWEAGRIVIASGTVLLGWNYHWGILVFSAVFCFGEMLYYGSLIGMMFHLSRKQAG